MEVLMRKALALGAAGALAALIGASPVQAQDFGVSVGFGTPGYDAGWGWGGYPAYSWGGPRYVGSYYAPVAGTYDYDQPATVVTTRRIVAAPAYDDYVAPRTVVRTRRVVAGAPVATRRTVVVRRVAAAPAYEYYAAPRTVITTRRVVAPAPVLEPRTVVTRRVVAAPVYDEFAAPRAVISTRRVVTESPAFDDDVVTTGSIAVAPRVVTRRTVGY
jgi:hypothetical protein